MKQANTHEQYRDEVERKMKTKKETKKDQG